MELREWFKYHTLSKKWLKSYIDMFVDIFQSKSKKEIEYTDKILWNENEIDIKVQWYFYGDGYGIDFMIENKYRKRWKWVENAKLEADMKWEVYFPDWHGTDEKYVWVIIVVEPEDLKQYILDLVEEYERETWEKYEFKYWSLEPTFLDKCKSYLK